jgi:hypothetical protein
VRAAVYCQGRALFAEGQKTHRDGVWKPQQARALDEVILPAIFVHSDLLQAGLLSHQAQPVLAQYGHWHLIHRTDRVWHGCTEVAWTHEILVWAVGASQGVEIDRREINRAENNCQHLLTAKQGRDTQ